MCDERQKTENNMEDEHFALVIKLENLNVPEKQDKVALRKQ